jgi:hypothetical protein
MQKSPSHRAVAAFLRQAFPYFLLLRGEHQMQSCSRRGSITVQTSPGPVTIGRAFPVDQMT